MDPKEIEGRTRHSNCSNELKECSRHNGSGECRDKKSKNERPGRRHCKLDKCKCESQSCCVNHCKSDEFHCKSENCKCTQGKCCETHCVYEPNHCKSNSCKCKSGKCCDDHCTFSQSNDDSNSVGNRIYYDSLVENEKDYLRLLLSSKVYNDSRSSSANFQFFKWISKQFEANKIFPVSSTLIESLNFLGSKSEVNFLFTNPPNQSKVQSYLDLIKKESKIDYESFELDIFSLAEATKLYIKENVTFFDEDIKSKINSLYETQQNSNDKKYFLERLPFLMVNRDLFKILKDVIIKSSNNMRKSQIKTESPINIWSDAILHDTVSENRPIIFNDILSQEYDYFPLSFYD